MLPVPQNHAAHVSHAGSVHQDLTGGDLPVLPDGLGAHLDHMADAGDQHVFGVDAHLAGQAGVLVQHPGLAVEGDHKFRAGQGQHHFQLFLAGVAGDVKVVAAPVNHLGPLGEQLVNDLGDGQLVAGNGGRGHDDQIVGVDVNLPVLGEGHAVQGAHLLPLAAGGDDDGLVFRHGLDLVHIHQDPGGDLHIAQLRADSHDVLHAPPGDAHLPAVLGGGVDDLLDAVDVAGEGGDDDALVAVLEQLVELVPHAALALGVPFLLHIGGVGQQGQHALVAQGPQPGQVRHASRHRRHVDLEVAGVDQHADGRVDGEGHRVGDGVVDVDEFHLKAASPDGLPRLHHLELGLL